MSDGACVAVVSRWLDVEGWGVLDAPQLPGGCWVHANAIDAVERRGLTPDSSVTVWWSRLKQDGYQFQADRVLPAAGPDYAAPITDADMLAALRALHTTDVEVVSTQELRPTTALVRILAIATGDKWEFELPLPSSHRLKPWLYRTPDDAQDAAWMLGAFLDEEVVTAAVRSARQDDAGRLLLAPYGFEQSERTEHERLHRAAGINGFHGRQTEAGSLDFTA